MKIRKEYKTYEEVLALPSWEHKRPAKSSFILRHIARVYVIPELLRTHFSFKKVDMERAGKGPWLVLMHHSSFIDLEIAERLLWPRPFNIIATEDTFMGKWKNWIMRRIGCIPTVKYYADLSLINDIKYAIHHNKHNVLLYPEAGYSFDGTATTLPERLGVLAKAVKAPVVFIQANGAFAREPLYRRTMKSSVNVDATIRCLISEEDIRTKSSDELTKVIEDAFVFDNYKWQQENKVRIDEAYRANGLQRILYKCPDCGAEGKMYGLGTKLKCNCCGASYILDEYGFMVKEGGEARFPHIPDWYRWERDEVRREIENGSFDIEADVEIGVIKNFDALYMIGNGHLSHTKDGFHLVGADGKLDYTQPATQSYTICADFHWFESGDIISIGTKEMVYYCFPKDEGVIAKSRLAAEELYKIHQQEKAEKRKQKLLQRQKNASEAEK